MNLNLPLNRMSLAELERMYFQAGLTEIAAIYTDRADLEATIAEQETAIEDAPDPADFAALKTERDYLRGKLEAAGAAIDALYRETDDAKRVNKAAILKALAAIDCESEYKP